VIFLFSASRIPATVSPKKRKNNRGKTEDVVSSDTENSDPKQRLSFAKQDGTLLQTNFELLLMFSIHISRFFERTLFLIKISFLR